MVQELQGYLLHLDHLSYDALDEEEQEETRRELERSRVEMQTSMQILETRLKRVAAAAAADAGGAGAADAGDGVVGRLRTLSDSAVEAGGRSGFGHGAGFAAMAARGRGGGRGGGGAGHPSRGPSSMASAGGGIGGSGASWGMGRNPYVVSARSLRPSYWLEFPFPWNVVPSDSTDLKAGDVFKITAGSLPKFGGDPADYIPWRSAFLPCVHMTSLDLSLKVMLLMGTLDMTTPQMREIRGSFAGNEDGYQEVISLLESTFGGEHNLLITRQQALLAVPHLQEGNYQGLEMLHIRLRTFLTEWGNAVGKTGEADSLSFFYILMNKLSPAYARKYEDWLRWNQAERGLYSLRAWSGEQLADHRRVAVYSRNIWGQGQMGRGVGGGQWANRGGFGRGQAGRGGGNVWGGRAGAAGGGGGRGAAPGGGAPPGGAPKWGGQHFVAGEDGEAGWQEVEDDFGAPDSAEQHLFGQGGQPSADGRCGYCQGEHLLGR